MYPIGRSDFRWSNLLDVAAAEYEKMQAGVLEWPDPKEAPRPNVLAHYIRNVDMEKEEVELWFGKVSFSGKEVAKHLQQSSSSRIDCNEMGKKMMKALKDVQDGKPLELEKEILRHVNRTTWMPRDLDSDLESNLSVELRPPTLIASSQNPDPGSEIHTAPSAGEDNDWVPSGAFGRGGRGSRGRGSRGRSSRGRSSRGG